MTYINENFLELGRLRAIVQDCMGKHLYSSAIFFADKLVTMSEGDEHDVYLLAEAYYMNKQYRRVLLLLKNEKLLDSNLDFQYLAAKCHAECKEWEECLATLGDSQEEQDNPPQTRAEVEGLGWRAMDRSSATHQLKMEAACCLLRGHVYNALENRSRATHWYKAALQADPFCYEALEQLLEHHMLTSEEEVELLNSLDFNEEFQWLQLMYSCKAKKYGGVESISVRLEELERKAAGSSCNTMGENVAAAGGRCGEQGEGTEEEAERGGGTGQVVAVRALRTLRTNADVIACQADWHYHRGEYSTCYEITNSLLQRDPYHLTCLPIHLSAALELRRKNELFLRAHKLMEECPDKAISWFAVGCYYFCVRNFDSSRRYFSRATQLCSNFAPAWLGYGNAFAAQDESDQAMAAYRTAMRLFPGSHLPMLCIGMEYQRTNNLPLAEQFFIQAHKICPADPLVCNELGVLAYRNKEYASAEQWLRSALALVPTNRKEAWEATVVNLAHALRKQLKVTEAVACYEDALALNPRGSCTHASLGYTHHLQGNLEEAIEFYHKALGLKPDDSFTHEMLDAALQEMCSSAQPVW